jgi:hypothetical protein
MQETKHWKNLQEDDYFLEGHDRLGQRAAHTSDGNSGAGETAVIGRGAESAGRLDVDQ